MDIDELIEEMKKRVEKLTKIQTTPKFQEAYWELYKRNKELITELAKWRHYLNITPLLKTDHALAFVIFRLNELYPDRWKKYLEKIMERVSKLPPGLWSNFLSILSSKYQIKYNIEVLSGKRKNPNLEIEYLQFSLKHLLRWIPFVEEELRKGNFIKANGPPLEYFPDWYFVADPVNEFYQKELIQKVEPLIQKEKKFCEDKVAMLNKMHELFVKHCWKPYFEDKLKPILLELKKDVEEEINLRETINNNLINRSTDIEDNHKLNIKLIDMLNSQQKEMKNLESNVKMISSKEIYEEVLKTVREFNEKIIEELAQIK